MNPEQMLYAALSAIREHVQLPGGYDWAPSAVTVAIGLVGLLLMIRGAKWAPGVGAVAFLGLGAMGGKFLADWLTTPLWPTVGISAVGAFVLGLVFFRIWQAAILASCCMVAALGAYYVHDLIPAVNSWVGGDGSASITLPAEGTVVGAAGTQVWANTQSLYNHLSANVANFQFNFWALAAGAGIAGLAFGLVLPRASRSIWAATIGTVLLGISATGLMQSYSPNALNWLMADNLRAWGIVGGVWAGSLAWNLVTSGPKKQKAAPATPATAKPAMA